MDVRTPYRGNHSCVVASNVVEHIEDDVLALKGTHELLRPGGYVVVFVPAFNFALGKFDRIVGHFRRYTKKSIRQAYEAAGLEVVEVKYVNMPGLLTWFLAVKLLRMTPSDGILVKVFDRVITPVARKWETKRRVPFGQSVLAIGRVPGN